MKAVKGILTALALVAAGGPAWGQMEDGTPVPAAADSESEDAQPPPASPPRGWGIVPRIALDETFTDNPRLTAAKHGDLVTAVTPGVAVSGRTRRLSANLDAALTYDKYAWATDLDGAVITAAADGLAEVVERMLFVDVRTDVSRQAISRAGAQSSTGRTLGANQAQVYNASISPYLRHDFADDAAGELRWRLSMAEFSGANSGDPVSGQLNPAVPSGSWTDEYSANLHSGPAFTRLRWAVDGWVSMTHYSGSRLVQQGSGLASAEWAMMREAALIAKGGWDSVRDSATGLSASAGAAAFGGVRLTPGPRTSLTVLGGRRWQGPYWSAEATWRISDALLLAASRDSTVTTAQQQINGNLNGLARNGTGVLVDPVTGQAPADANQLANSYASRIYTLDTNRVSLTGDRGPDRISLVALYLTETIGAQELGQSGASRQSVAELDVLYTRRLSRVSDASLTLGLSRTYDSAQTNEATIAQVGLTYGRNFSPTLRGTVSLRHTDLSAPAGTGYRENAAIIGVRKQM
jgi:uncharacterized protein (PEP-CTERM system associated)